MDTNELLSSGLVGLVAGGLTSALVPGRSPLVLLGLVAVGLVGAVLGGWCWWLFFSGSASTFLGAVIGGVVAAVGVLAAAARLRGGRYRL